MLTIQTGRTHRGFCDNVSRRSFLQVGGMLGGLTLTRLLQAERIAGTGASNKSIIMVYLPGGPPHQDMFDIKTQAPSEIRGEFSPIKTSVPGIEICEHLPGIAANAHRMAFLRSMVGAKDRHESFQCLTGRLNENQPAGGWPELGSVLSQLRGPKHPAMPPYVGLSPRMQHTPYNSGKPGFLGPAHTPFQPNGDGRDDLKLGSISVDRLGNRRSLLGQLDSLRRRVDESSIVAGADALQQQALGVLTSSRLADALDVEKEPQAVRDRYGYGTDKIQGDAAPRLNQQFLMARRLIEAGARCVTLSYSFWDWHGSNFARARENFPDLDQAVTALVCDLHERGMSDDVTVIVYGEFGRTPRINDQGGRDHWPNVSCALLAGGGLQMGQAIGTTDRLGGEAKDRPVHFQELFATLYHALGLESGTTTVRDLTGRPQYLVDGDYQPLPELT